LNFEFSLEKRAARFASAWIPSVAKSGMRIGMANEEAIFLSIQNPKFKIQNLR